MNTISWLSGNVSKQSLPCLAPPTAPNAPMLKRLLLPQGELAQFHDSETPVRYLALLDLMEGTIRGQHYHLKKKEWVYLGRGELTLVAEDLATKERETIPVRAGDLVHIAPGIAHALRVVEAGYAVEFSPHRFDPADTHRYPLD